MAKPWLHRLFNVIAGIILKNNFSGLPGAGTGGYCHDFPPYNSLIILGSDGPAHYLDWHYGPRKIWFCP